MISAHTARDVKRSDLYILAHEVVYSRVMMVVRHKVISEVL